MNTGDPLDGLVGTYYHAAELWESARALSRRFEKAEAELDPGRVPPGLSVILFAAISVETFLSEMVHLASQHTDEPIALAVCDALEEVEDARGSIRLKLQVATLILSGRPIDRGKAPYQDFALLFKVRDEIVHLKPHRHTWGAGAVVVEPKALLATLYARKLIRDPRKREAQPFLKMLATSALCNWSVNTSRETIRYVVSLVPAGRFKERLEDLNSEVLTDSDDEG